MYLDCKTKEIFAIACLGKKLVFHTEICEFRNLRISRLANFKNRSFLLDQGVVQMESDLVWSIPRVGRF